MADLSKGKHVVGFIGAGNMAGALVRGLVQGGLPAAQALVTDIDKDKAETLAKELGARAFSSPDLVAQSSVIILAVKPGGITKVAEEHRGKTAGKLWISIAAGISTYQIEESLGAGARVVRAMPNTPCLVGQGATGLCAGSHATDEDLKLAQDLLSAVGITEIVDESMMDAVTAVSGSGPAFVMLVIESMTDGAVRAGLPRPIAQRLATQTVMGSAALLQQTGKHPGELKDMVTSPGGTTIAGVAALEAAGLRSAFISAVTSAAERSRQLSGKS